MALYRVSLPDGSDYQIEAPEGASETSLILTAQQHARDERSAALKQRLADLRANAPKPETTVGGNVKEFFKGVVPGAVGLAETAGTGIAALLPDEAEKSTRATLKDMATAAKKPFEAAPGYEGLSLIHI